jgi:capsular polysaccharide biosynthesis protein
MKTARPLFERLYAEFVRLYPGRFHDEFAAEMQRLLREQYRDARNAGWLSVTSLWFRTLRDLGSSLVRQHIEELKANMNAHFLLQFCSKNLTFTRLLLGLTVCLVGLCVLVTLLALPQVYMSTARILIDMPEEKYDSYPAHTVLEQIKSRKVLDPVIARLNLTSALAKESGRKGELTPDEAYQNLLRMISLRQSRNAPLVEIGVYSQNRDLCAKIANEITEVAMRMSAMNRHGRTVDDARENSDANNARISCLEMAVPESRPVRPNVPLNIVVGSVLSVVLASVMAGFTRLFLKAASPT